VLDAGLISKAQHVEHYEIAGYGTVRTYARQLGEEEQAQLLQETLDEEGETDKLLTELAERSINLEAEQAGEEQEEEAGAGRGEREVSRRAASEGGRAKSGGATRKRSSRGEAEAR
jgi:hypothetical protein